MALISLPAGGNCLAGLRRGKIAWKFPFEDARFQLEASQASAAGGREYVACQLWPR
jgi:hypothetical protein